MENSIQDKILIVGVDISDNQSVDKEISEINLDNEKENLEDLIEKGYVKSVEYENLHKTNKEHLDWGRVDLNARKLRAMRGRLNISAFNDLSETERISNINKHALWIEDFEQLENRGYSNFGKAFYKIIRNSISSRPVSSNDTILHLHEDPLINAEMMTAIYLWGNEQILSQFESQPIVSLTDSLLFIRGLSEKGLLFPTNQFTADDNMTQLLSDSGAFDYFEIDLLAKAGKLEKVQIDFTKVKNFMLEQFPEHHDLLNSYSNLHYNYLVGAQLGRSFRNKITDFQNTLLKAKYQAERISNDDNEFDILNNVEEYTPNSDGEIHLIQELSMISAMNIRYTGLGINNVTIKNSDEHTLKNKNLHNSERTGYDWFGANTISDDNESYNFAIKADNLAENFKISGVQWGASVNGIKEREEWLKLISEAFADLALANNMEIQDVGLEINNVGMGVAIGSHGYKGSVAHYRTSKHYLHLNRNKSVGSLAHEWTHAYDNYLFHKALEQDIFPNEVMTKILSNNNYGSYFNALRSFLALPKYEEHQSYHNIKNFDEHLFKLGELVWQKKQVLLENNNLGQEFVDNFNNYDKRENVFNKFDNLIERTIDNYKRFISDLNLCSNYCSFEKINEMTFEEAEMNMLQNENLKSSFGFLNFGINEIMGMDSPYFNTFLKKNENTNKYEVTLEKMQDEKFKLGLFKNLATSLQDYRQNILNNDNLSQIKENVLQTLMANEEKIFNEFKQNSQLSDQLKNIIGKQDEQVVNVEQVRKSLFENQMISQSFEQSIKNGYNQLSTDLSKILHQQDQLLGKNGSFFGHVLQRYLNNESQSLTTDLKDLATNRLIQEIHKEILSQEKSLSLGNRVSHLYGQSIKADNLNYSGEDTSAKAYYSRPEELFARIGETTIFKSLEEMGMKNLFLTNTGEKIKINHSNGTPDVYPINGEQTEMIKLMKNSFGNHFKPFNLNLDNINVIQNEYSHINENNDNLEMDNLENEVENDDLNQIQSNKSKNKNNM